MGCLAGPPPLLIIKPRVITAVIASVIVVVGRRVTVVGFAVVVGAPVPAPAVFAA